MALCYPEKKSKYDHPELEDEQVESLAKYFKIDGYPNLALFLRHMRGMDQTIVTTE